MNSTITVRDIDPRDKAWLKKQAQSQGLSMEAYVRRIIHERRAKTERRPRPSAAFGQWFGREHGVELPRRGAVGYQPVQFTETGEQ